MAALAVVVNGLALVVTASVLLTLMALLVIASELLPLIALAVVVDWVLVDGNNLLNKLSFSVLEVTATSVDDDESF